MTLKTEAEPTPEPAPATPGWALVNLILGITTVLVAAWAALKKRGEGEDAKRRKTIAMIGLAPALAAVATFFLTQNLSLPMQIADKWTALMAVYLAGCGATTFLSREKKN